MSEDKKPRGTDPKIKELAMADIAAGATHKATGLKYDIKPSTIASWYKTKSTVAKKSERESKFEAKVWKLIEKDEVFKQKMIDLYIETEL